MIRLIAFIALTGISVAGQAEPISYYLPGTEYDPSIPEPSAVIGHQVGEWHVTHDKLAAYMQQLASTSGRVMLNETGKTWEGRPLQQLVISAPHNLARLDDIRARHRALGDPRNPGRVEADMPVVVWLGYSVHGNEPSGSNASLVVAYHLAAAMDEWTMSLLEDTVILLDPALNPDGLNRFATWVNMHRSARPVPDRQSREFSEVWPGARTNHYWFDLNRDWLLLVHPESRARIREFQRWRPHVLTDHHEMGTDATYFFQPGVPSRMNPLIPQRNQELTTRIGAYHARALDSVGQSYYTREGFDDFYLGKGSTYPDLHGSIGILFEQASSRGHMQDSVHGQLTFATTIRNQVLTSFSTLRAAHDMRMDLLRYQREFYETAYSEGRRDAVRGWVFGDDGDPARAGDFISVLLQHGIDVLPLVRDVSIDGTTYRAGAAWVVPTAQPQYLLARGIFETRTRFEDEAFYDVSTWTLPLAYGLPYAELRRHFSDRIVGTPLADLPTRGMPPSPGAEGAVAYLFDWGMSHAPRALHRLLAAGVVVRAATRPFTLETRAGHHSFGRGAVVIPMGVQTLDREEIMAILEVIRGEDGIRVHATGTGLAESGIDLGSPSVKPVGMPRVALLVGSGVNAYEAGEVWHFLDTRHEIPVTLLDIASFGRHDLGRYTHLVMVDGGYDDALAGKVGAWVRSGGVLLAGKRAAKWAVDNDLAQVEFAPASVVGEGPTRRDYADHRGDWEAQLLRGAIFRADLDTTHPLGWGIPRREMPVFRNSTLVMKESANRYETVLRLDTGPQWSGYVSSENLARLSGSASVVVQRRGQGSVVLMADNLLFRGYWLGTARVFLNAIFLGGLVERTQADAGD